MKGKSSLIVNYGVSRISASLVTANYIIFLGKKVNHTALAFITPVNSNYYTIRHTVSPF